MKIAVIGAGLAGLAAGYRLQQHGHEVVLYEASARAGGRALRLQRPGTQDWADVGSQYFHSDYRRAFALIRDLGLEDQLKPVQGDTRMFSAPGASYRLDQRLPWLRPQGALLNAFDNLRLAWYLLRLLLRERGHTYAASDRQLGLDASDALASSAHKFVQDHAVRMMSLIGGLSEPAATQLNLLQIQRLVKIILFTRYVSLKDGTAALHARLAQELTIRCQAPVARLLEDDHRVRGLELDDGEKIAADHVLVAAHAPAAAKLLPDGWTQERQFLAGIEMPPFLLVSFFLDRSLEEGVWSYFLPFDHDGVVSFLVDTQQKNPASTPSGKATLQAWINHPASTRLYGDSDEAVAAASRADIASYMPGFESWIEGYAVTRHAAAVPQTARGHTARALRFLAQVARRPGVSFCGDYFSGGYMECALWSVERALQQIGKASQSG